MKTLCIVTFIILTNKYLSATHTRIVSSKDKSLSFAGLAKKYGYFAEEYDVKTEDGYFLKLFRIPGRRGLPVLLMHGVTDSCDTWLLRGENSLGIALADREYDVWFGNIRGNKYARRHMYLDPEKDAAFFNYSFHEHGYYDLPVIIDKVLATTGAEKLNAFGHSQGNTIFYVLGATRPEYNEKINVMTALAPICYLQHIPPPLSLVIAVAPEINALAKAIGLEELFGPSSTMGKFIDFICNVVLMRYPICAFGVIFPLSGFDLIEFSPSFYDVIIKHYPDATTRKNLYHLSQVARRRSFSMYDHGPYQNLKEYNSIMPPDYDLKKVTMPIVLIAGRNDKLSVLEDVEILRAQLPNVESYILVDRKVMNHLDYIWGKNMNDYLFPHIFNILERNNFEYDKSIKIIS